jgi:hypothetical protein
VIKKNSMRSQWYSKTMPMLDKVHVLVNTNIHYFIIHWKFNGHNFLARRGCEEKLDQVVVIKLSSMTLIIDPAKTYPMN